MTIETMKQAVEILEKQNETVTLDYPGHINLQRSGWIYVFGDANDTFDGDAYPSWEAFVKGEAPESITTPLPSDSVQPEAVAKAILDAVAEHQSRQEPRFLVLNETDGVLAHPDPMTRAECDAFMEAFRRRFDAQGYYAGVEGRIPVSELRLKRIPEGEL